MRRRRCNKCGQLRRPTQFSLTKRSDKTETGFTRADTCRVCNYDGLTADERHKILREAYRHYLTWKDLLTYPEDGAPPPNIITYNIPKEAGSEEAVPVSISFHDLERALHQFNGEMHNQGTVLSKRKEEAFYLNVIRDMLQRDVAEIMGITTVSVGQYVDQSVLQLAEYYFSEDTLNHKDTTHND